MSLSDLEALEHIGVMLSYLNLRAISVSQPKYLCHFFHPLFIYYM